MEVNGQFHGPAALALGKTPLPTHTCWIGGWVGSRANLDEYQAVSLVVKWPLHEVYCSPLYNAMVKNVWSYTSTPLYVLMAWCLN
jgi:hypothetical protein